MHRSKNEWEKIFNFLMQEDSFNKFLKLISRVF